MSPPGTAKRCQTGPLLFTPTPCSGHPMRRLRASRLRGEPLRLCIAGGKEENSLFSSSSLSQTVGGSEVTTHGNLVWWAGGKKVCRGRTRMSPSDGAPADADSSATLLGSHSSSWTKCGDSRPSPFIIPVEKTLSEVPRSREGRGWQSSGGSERREGTWRRASIPSPNHCEEEVVIVPLLWLPSVWDDLHCSGNSVPLSTRWLAWETPPLASHSVKELLGL